MTTRLLLPATLVAGGAIAGGLASVLAILIAAMLVLDQVLPSSRWGEAAAHARYRSVARARRRAELSARLHRREPDRLAYLETDAGWAASARRRRLGVQPIAVASIVGTVEAQKAVAFDAQLRPPAWSRGRWTLLCEATQRGAALPPIEVYRVGDRYYVRDGHHRASVARATGANAIDADVVELR
jgi:hypothetical protein